MAGRSGVGLGAGRRAPSPDMRAQWGTWTGILLTGGLVLQGSVCPTPWIHQHVQGFDKEGACGSG